MDDAVFDYRTLRGADPTVVPVFAVLARIDDVRARIGSVREALGIEPERVGSGPLPLAKVRRPLPARDAGSDRAVALQVLAGSVRLGRRPRVSLWLLDSLGNGSSTTVRRCV